MFFSFNIEDCDQTLSIIIINVKPNVKLNLVSIYIIKVEVKIMM